MAIELVVEPRNTLYTRRELRQIAGGFAAHHTPRKGTTRAMSSASGATVRSKR